MICNTCKFECVYVEELLRHIFREHACLHNFTYRCCLDDCNVIFRLFRQVYNHYLRRHSKNWRKNQSNQTLINWSCEFCDYKSSEFIIFKNHYLNHVRDKGQIKCFMIGCEFKSENYKYFQTHFTRKHKTFDINTCIFDDRNMFEDNDNETYNQHENDNNQESDLLSMSGSHKSIQDIYLSLFLKYRDVYKIPESTVQLVFDDIKNLIELSHVDVLKSVSGDNSLSNHKAFIEAQKYFSNKNNIVKEQNKSIYYIEPEEFKLNEKKVFHYVSIRRVIIALVESKKINLIYPYSNNTELTSFNDGKLFKKHQLFSKQASIKIKLFFDELETVDAIGFNRGKHKLGGFYYTINDTPVDFNSRLEDIYVAILVKSVLIKEYGFFKILEPLIRDLKQLEDGFILNERVVRGSLCVIVGDNLAANQIGGFIESFSHDYYCRYCILDKDEVNNTLNPKEFHLRTVES